MGEQKRSLLRQLYLPAVLCTALWGSAAPCVKRGYELFAVSADAPLSQLVFAGWRFALAGILVLLVTRLKGHRIVPKRDEIKPILAISLFQSMLQYVCYYIGLSGTTGTKGSVLSGTQTFFALLLAHCLLPNDKLNRRKTLGCICGFAGVLALGLGGLNGFNLTGLEQALAFPFQIVAQRVPRQLAHGKLLANPGRRLAQTMHGKARKEPIRWL